LADAADFTNNKYPNIDVAFEVLDLDDITAGIPSYLTVNIEREIDREDDGETNGNGGNPADPDVRVHAPFFPAEKTENWWLVVGDEKSKTLLAIKRITIARKLSTRLEYVVPTKGKHELTLYLMSDSYVGVDQAPTFEVVAAEGVEDDEEKEGEGVEDGEKAPAD